MNIDRLNRVIEAIRAEPKHFVMSDWIHLGDAEVSGNDIDPQNLKCGTAGCIGGWAEILAASDARLGKYEIPNYPDSDAQVRGSTLSALWLDVPDGSYERDELTNLFMMDHKFNMGDFDELSPEDRAKAAIRAIEIFRDTGTSNWEQALRETGLLHKLYKIDC